MALSATPNMLIFDGEALVRHREGPIRVAMVFASSETVILTAMPRRDPHLPRCDTEPNFNQVSDRLKHDDAASRVVPTLRGTEGKNRRPGQDLS